jgi:hypothetical protein
MWDYEVGMQVVCINDEGFINLSRGEVVPKVGNIYTIRWLEVYDNELCCRLHEIVNPEMQYGPEFCECMFIVPKHFRPVKKTDISDLEKLLKTNYDLGDLANGLSDGEYLPRVKEFENV